MKFLVIGGNGLIGRYVIEELNGKYTWEGTYFSRTIDQFHQCDISDVNNVEEVINALQPSHVILCSNLKGGVGFCEENPEVARKYHYQGIVNVGKACQNRDIKMLYISSECVFDGNKEKYVETDAPNPISVYGKCKAESERWIKDNLKKYIIVRTISVYGWDPETTSPNAMMSAYFALSQGKSIDVPTYRWSNPTYVGDLAKAIVELCLCDEIGIFHVAGAEYLNRFEWIKKSAQELGWDSALLIPKEIEPNGGPKYPKKVMLDSTKFLSKFQTSLHGVDDSLREIKKSIN